MTLLTYVLIGVIVAFLEVGIVELTSGLDFADGDRKLLFAYMLMSAACWPVVVFTYLAVVGGVGVIAASCRFFGKPFSFSEFKKHILYLTS